jgi:RimJ/RimL family protein N-acetyltransferase
MIESSRLLLRAVELTDVTENYRSWMNDPAVMQYTESRFQTHSLEQIRDYVAVVQEDFGSRFFAIIEKESGKHIGNIKISHIHPVHRHADVGIIIGDKESWGKGYATESLRLIACYAQESLQLRKLTAGIYANNTGSVQAFLKAGFTEEGRFAKHWFCDGEYVDGLQMGLLLAVAL